MIAINFPKGFKERIPNFRVDNKLNNIILLSQKF